jgi:hypothetical protein
MTPAILPSSNSSTSRKQVMTQIIEPMKLDNGEKLTYGFGINIEKYRGYSRLGHGGGTQVFERIPFISLKKDWELLFSATSAVLIQLQYQ